MTTALLKQAAKLPVPDRIKLVEDIWNSIADEADKLPLTAAQTAELDRRVELHEAKSGPRNFLGRSETQDTKTPFAQKMTRRFTFQIEVKRHAGRKNG